MEKKDHLEKLCRLLRYDILTATTAAESGHATSALSAVELGAVLFFGGFFHQDLKSPKDLANDKFILSKGHASPLLYSLYEVAGALTHQEILSLRKLNSHLQGHPTPEFPYVDVATGSLGQGLSVGLGMALGLRMKFKIPPNVFVLMGDSEFSEGQIYEALQLASFYKAGNLIGVLDVNRLGQSCETMLGWDVQTYEKRVSSFGWNTVVIDDGHDIEKVKEGYQKALQFSSGSNGKPTMTIAKTIKGKGISFLEDKEGWHGKPVPKDKLDEALKELGEVDLSLKGEISLPVIPAKAEIQTGSPIKSGMTTPSNYEIGQEISTREAFGDTITLVGQINPNLVSLDGEVSNSTLSEKFRKTFPDRYFEMFIAEQNMVSVALGLSKVGYVPFVSTFAAFFTRTFDQIRMAYYSRADLKFVGSHVGVFIGQDGPSQMGLEDFALFRAIQESTILCPSDAVSAAKLIEKMVDTKGIVYLRTNRNPTPVLYNSDEAFEIGGSKVLKQNENDTAVVFATGVCVSEALKAQALLEKENISIAVVDLYSIKPIDHKTIQQYSNKTKRVIVVEDHYPYGALGEAVASTISKFKVQISNFTHLCVRKLPRSGTPEELLNYEEIDDDAIIRAVKS